VKPGAATLPADVLAAIGRRLKRSPVAGNADLTLTLRPYGVLWLTPS
jgi:hypothetical protein